MSAWRNERAAVIGVAAYALMAIVTFGHSAASAGHQCAAMRVKPLTCDHTFFVYGGVLAGMGWPLYWSWQVQS